MKTLSNKLLTAIATCLAIGVATPAVAVEGPRFEFRVGGALGAATPVFEGVALLTPPGLSFGNQSLNTTSLSQYVTVTNTGGAPLSVGGVGLLSGGGDFNQSNTCGSSLAIGASCTISVAFTPTQAGMRTGSVGFSTGGAGAKQFAVSGLGIVAAAVDSASFADAYITAGSPATFSWAVSNAVSASVACSGTTSGASSGLSGTLAAATAGEGVGVCTVTAVTAQGTSTSSSAQVMVVASPIVTSALFVNPSVRLGEPATFTWATTGATSASVVCYAPVVGSGEGLSGSISVSASRVGTGTCSVVALNDAGRAAIRSATLETTERP